MMRDRGSLCDSAINGNWVLKRKRKRSTLAVSPSDEKEGTSPASDSSRNNASIKKKLKHDVDISRFANKIKGRDGYFYECVECDLGGNLLCCDSCPRTYHLECLNPPLKRAPPGSWQCPKCREESNSVKLSGSKDANNSKRARTKRVFESTTSEKTPGHNKVSVYNRRSIQETSRSNDKGKLSCDDGARNDDLSLTDNEVEKKTVSLLQLKKRPAKERSVNTKRLKLVLLEKSCEEKPEKHESSLKMKKQKTNISESKRPGTKKVKYLATDVYSASSTELSPCPDHSESPPKGKSLDIRTPPSVAKEGKKKVKFVDKNHAKIAVPTTQGIQEQDLVVDKVMTPQDFLQVDRILGCRLQTSQTVSPSNAASEQIESMSSSRLEAGVPPSDHVRPQTSCVISNNCHKGKQSSCSNGINCAPRDTCRDEAANHDGENHLDVGKELEENNVTLRENKESAKEDRITTAVLQSSVDQHITGKDAGAVEDDKTAINAGNGALTDRPVERGDSELHTSETEVTMWTKQGHTPESKIHAKVEGIAGNDHGNIVYEFLVKWLGKSNIHNSWVSESELKVLAKRKLENYKAKYGTSLINICKDQWNQPQRIVGLRVSLDGVEEALVKWCSLPYDECTWERLDEPVMENSIHLVTQFKHFESQALDKDTRDGYANTKSDCQEINALVEQPKELQGGMLFPHQLEALNWLRKCWYRSKNVILADEMGLGKTVSACAFLSSLYCEFKVRLPCLVLVPLSTMPNWMAEFASWAPHLNVVEYHGSARARSFIRQYEWHAGDVMTGKTTKTYKFNVLLTTYEMVLADASHLRSVPWEVLIVDEGHRLKNSGSKLFSLLNAFSFQHRVLLTGTPLQNNIGEMYNLLNFLQPASFPCLASFEEKFNDLTTAEKVEELKKLVAPHMLRRLKKDAMQNIPPKTERMVPVELSSIQAEYYRAMLTKNYQVLRNIGKGGAQQSLLNIVMQLRKVCNHPYLIPGTEPESGSLEFLHEMRIKASAKLTLLHSMLKILHRDGHRVLLFSQMTKLLDILEDYLTLEFGPKTFERVDGSVSVADRQAAIARFNQDKTRFVFLLSTRSCGLGINLATADTVIIYDSDFNPHADIQAMNRAHRIGQSNRLLVYRLVVRASVEERILQLAKKKLMLDQLFVNKSESQKEVEDIIRWGTEELFRDNDVVNGQDNKEASSTKYDVADVEFKHRRRTGGLGDVYEDKCAAGSAKIIWDENAILKLLDRSNLPSTISESTDGDLESDMLGTVKSIDWNDDLNDEPGGNDDLPSTDGDACEQASEPKQDNAANGAEENEWDKLLRVRWEKYQIEEEASLGRGKRLRKAVSYRESFAAIPAEALSESSDEEDEPKREYTSAGRAFKEKYGKLRARQKERIAQRHAINISADEKLGGSVQTHDTNNHEHDLDPGKNAECAGQEDASFGQAFGPQCLSEPTAELRQSSKQRKRYPETPEELSARLAENTSSSKHHLQTGVSTPVTPSHLLPVLGLCAPNADKVNLYRDSHTGHSIKGQRKVSSETINIPPPASIPQHSIEQKNERQSTPHRPLFPDSSEEALRRLKNIIPDSYFPFHPIPPTSSGKGLYDPVEKPGSSFASFQEKLGLPSLNLDGSIPFKRTKQLPDLFPSLSLGTNKEYTINSVPEFPNVPLLPNFMHNMTNALRQKQHMAGLPPMMGLSQVPPTQSSMPENHKKVLDSIMMRTQLGTNKFLKRRSKPDFWSEDELDALWVGVRRHGRGNWDAMLRDLRLKFSNHRTSEDLASRWSLEERKILEEPMSTAPRSSKSAAFPGLSDGMMSRALQGSKFSRLRMEPPKFHSHLTDIELGCSDVFSGFPHGEPSNYMNSNEGSPSLAQLQDLKHRSRYGGDFPGGTLDKLERPDIGLVPPFLSNPFMRENIGSLLTNGQKGASVEQNEAGPRARENIFAPGISDKQVGLFPELQRHMKLVKDPMEMNVNVRKHSTSPPIVNSSGVGSSKSNKLPHWLQEAVRAPASKPPEPQLPPAVSALAQSVRLLFGEENSTIPPFQIPGPRLFRPKDPRSSLKKRKLHKVQQAASRAQHPENKFGQVDGVAIPPAPPFLEVPPGFQRIEKNDLSRSLNLNAPSSSSVDSQPHDEPRRSTRQEVHQPIIGSAATAASGTPPREAPEPSCQRTGLSVVDTPGPSGRRTEEPASGADVDTKHSDLMEEDTRIGGRQGLDCSGNLKEQLTPDESRDPSTSWSDSFHINQTEAEEDQTEENVSDER